MELYYKQVATFCPCPEEKKTCFTSFQKEPYLVVQIWFCLIHDFNDTHGDDNDDDEGKEEEEKFDNKDDKYFVSTLFDSFLHHVE